MIFLAWYQKYFFKLRKGAMWIKLSLPNSLKNRFRLISRLSHAQMSDSCVFSPHKASVPQERRWQEWLLYSCWQMPTCLLGAGLLGDSLRAAWTADKLRGPASGVQLVSVAAGTRPWSCQSSLSVFSPCHLAALVLITAPC